MKYIVNAIDSKNDYGIEMTAEELKIFKTKAFKDYHYILVLRYIKNNEMHFALEEIHDKDLIKIFSEIF